MNRFLIQFDLNRLNTASIRLQYGNEQWGQMSKILDSTGFESLQCDDRCQISITEKHRGKKERSQPIDKLMEMNSDTTGHYQKRS